jgi:hypothetical protein
MAKRLQHRGGTTSQHSSFTGAVREVTVDTDKNTLVVHDGATAGGHPLATATNFKSTGIDDNATSTAITIDSSQNVSFNDDTGNTQKLIWNATDESLRLKVSPSTYGDYYVAYPVPRIGSGTINSDVVLIIGEKDVNVLRIQGRFYTPNVPNVSNNRNAFIVDIIYQQWNSQLPRFSYDAIHTGSRAQTADNMELGEAVYDGTTYYAIKIQANTSSLGGQPIYFTGGITNTTDLGYLPEDALTSFTAVIPSSNDSSDKRISAENIRFKNEKNEDKMLITSDGNISFYEDTGTTPQFFWDASTERLGIGTTTPSEKIEVQSSVDSRVKAKTTTSTAIGGFEAWNNSSAYIKLYSYGTVYSGSTFGGVANANLSLLESQGASNVVFSTWGNAGGSNPDFIFAPQRSQKVIIKSDGKVGIGTSSPESLFHIESYTSDPTLQITNKSVAQIDTGPDIEFWNNPFTATTTNSYESGAIRVRKTNGSNNHHDHYMSFWTRQNSPEGINERMRITSSGNVGIGTTSPGSPLTVSGGTNTTIANFNNNVSATTSVSNALLIQSNCSGSAGVGFGLGIAFNGERNDGNTQRFGNIYWEATTNSGTSLATDFFLQHYNGTETFRVKQNGRLVRNSNALASAHGNFIGEVGASYKALSFSHTSGGVEVGSVTTGASSTAYNTSSDYRLKENVSYDFDATTRLKQLRPARFNFIADADTTVDGFLAHEVSNVVPEAITGEKDETETKEKVVVNANGNVIAENIEQADWETGKIANEDGNTKYPTDSTWEATKVVPVYQGIDQSKLVPLLVKTIQELEARITALETTTP